ncbi:MAG: histidine--tRNA ligase [Kofleriaceae bacterium]
MPVQPRTPPGVMELLPPQQLAFQRMLDTIRRGFERFGFLPVETPAFELADVLLTKSGGETEKQVYFVQSTGALKEGKAPELALRFDLTVPLARYVAQHEHQLNFPFKRYQIQRVYRGEKNQKGRYREFYQCDIDVIGKDALPLAYDAECPAIIHAIFTELGFGAFTIKINNRKLLRGLLQSLGVEDDKQASVLHEVDRLGKMAREEIVARLSGADVGMPADKAAVLMDALAPLSPSDPIERLASLQNMNDVFQSGLADLRRVREGAIALGIPPSQIVVDLSIVRGLDYYTGTVYETFLDDQPSLGSICSGGRYDNLAGHYTKSKLPGVGISIGITRLLSHLLESPSFASATTTHVIVLNLDANLSMEYAKIATELRAAGFNVEVFFGEQKLGKQFQFADKSRIPLAVVMGGNEHSAGQVKIKDLRASMDAAQKETTIARASLVDEVKRLLGAAR